MPYQSVFRPGLFAGQVVIVTGGGSGIGRCTAHELASLGATVALVGRTPEKLEAVAAEIAEDGGQASTHACDIREEAQVSTTVEAVLARHGRLNALVNNAGGQYRSPMQDISTKGFEAVVRNNLTGGFIFMRAAGMSHWARSRSNSRHRARSTSDLRHIVYMSIRVAAMVTKCAPCFATDRQKAPSSGSVRCRWCSAAGTSMTPRSGKAGLTSTSSFWIA